MSSYGGEPRIDYSFLESATRDIRRVCGGAKKESGLENKKTSARPVSREELYRFVPYRFDVTQPLHEQLEAAKKRFGLARRRYENVFGRGGHRSLRSGDGSICTMRTYGYGTFVCEGDLLLKSLRRFTQMKLEASSGSGSTINVPRPS